MFNKEKYICAKVQKCEIVPGKRGHCAYCRYQKCLRLGMSVEGIILSVNYIACGGGGGDDGGGDSANGDIISLVLTVVVQ